MFRVTRRSHSSSSMVRRHPASFDRNSNASRLETMGQRRSELAPDFAVSSAALRTCWITQLAIGEWRDLCASFGHDDGRRILAARPNRDHDECLP